jgi:hypothetical protein
MCLTNWHVYRFWSLILSCLKTGIIIIINIIIIISDGTATHYGLDSPGIKSWWGHIFLNQNSYLCLCTIFISFCKSFSFLRSSFRSSIYNKWLIFLSVPCTWYLQSAQFSSFVDRMSAIQNRNGERESPWNIPLHIWMGCDCITS